MKSEMELSVINNSTWFKHWFDSSFYHKLYSNRDEKEAAGFIDALLNDLDPVEYSNMLDLGCGAGRHARYLASKGFNVTGIDLAMNSIREARKSGMVGLQFYQHDMRAPFGNNRFDYVFNFFTSFGYFKDQRENNQVINNISNALKPGGIALIDYINVDYSEGRLIAEETKELDGIVYHLTRWSDHRNFYKKIGIDDVQAEGSFEYIEQVAKFDLDDFEDMFRDNGLELQAVYGDYELGGYDTKTSPRLILIAKNTASEKDIDEKK